MLLEVHEQHISTLGPSLLKHLRELTWELGSFSHSHEMFRGARVLYVCVTEAVLRPADKATPASTLLTTHSPNSGQLARHAEPQHAAPTRGANSAHNYNYNYVLITCYLRVNYVLITC